MGPNASTTRPLYSGELARLAGISPDTLRYYERCRLLPAAPRAASGYRLFPPHALTRVRLIRGALSLGFSVKELAAIFGQRDRGEAPCHRVRALAAGKLANVEAQLRDLRTHREDLRKTLAEWDRILGKTPQGQRAGLLEAFVASHPTRRTRAAVLNSAAQKVRRQHGRLPHARRAHESRLDFAYHGGAR